MLALMHSLVPVHSLQADPDIDASPGLPLLCLCVQYVSSTFCSAAVKLDAQTDISKLKISQLKQLLKDRGDDCLDCLEKSDFVRKVQHLVAASA